MKSAHVDVEIDLPEGVSIRGYELHQGVLVFEVGVEVPKRCACPACGWEAEVDVPHSDELFAIRDLDLFGRPSFWVYQPPIYQCLHCRQRTQLLTRFKRPHTTYTYRFEQYVMETLVGSSVEFVARRLGISAETIEQILEQQLQDRRVIRSNAQITSLGFDELSLKKRRKLNVTIMSDLSVLEYPRVLAVEAGRDGEAAEKCLAMLTPEQRQAVRSHRTGMNAVYQEACGKWLLNSKLVVDRLPVANRLSQAVDQVRERHAVSS